MNVVLTQSLTKGATLIDYAYSNRGETLNLSVPDYVGLVAAYLDQGRYSDNLHEELNERLGKTIADGAQKVFHIFDDYQGHGLWSQGPAAEDVRLTNRKLEQVFRRVNAVHERTVKG